MFSKRAFAAAGISNNCYTIVDIKYIADIISIDCDYFVAFI